MGWVIKIDDIAAKSVKSRLPAVFEGGFQSPKNSNFIDDIAFLELKTDFRAVRWKKSHGLFSSLKIYKKVVSKNITIFWKNFFDKFWRKMSLKCQKCMNILKSLKNWIQRKWFIFINLKFYIKCYLQGWNVYGRTWKNFKPIFANIGKLTEVVVLESLWYTFL